MFLENCLELTFWWLNRALSMVLAVFTTGDVERMQQISPRTLLYELLDILILNILDHLLFLCVFFFLVFYFAALADRFDPRHFFESFFVFP